MPTTISDRTYGFSLLYEDAMLIDYIAANATKKLSALEITEEESKLDASKILCIIGDLQHKTSESQSSPIDPKDLTRLQLIRDALNGLASPATGLTVAYTALVTGRVREGKSKSRETMAQIAYPALRLSALIHRYTLRFFLVLAIIITLCAAWESAKVALGKSLLQNLEGLRTQQASIATEKSRIATEFNPVTSHSAAPDALLVTIGDRQVVHPTAFALCDRKRVLADYFAAILAKQNSLLPMGPVSRQCATGDGGSCKYTTEAPLEMAESEAERDVCGRDEILRRNFEIVHEDLKTYLDDWTVLVGNVFSPVAAVGRTVQACFCERWVRCGPTRITLVPGQEDVEFLVAPALLVWGNYVLPVLFSLLGALIYVILEFYSKIKESRLTPRDGSLCWIRVVLGLVTGACIGLLFSASSSPPTQAPSQLIASLTLSASGVAFLSGFGVEGVFTALQSLVNRLFPTNGADGHGD